MASNIDKFISDINKEIKDLQIKKVGEAKTIILGTYSHILDRSPVDSSLFKHNHIITVNSKTNETKGLENNEVSNNATVQVADLKQGTTITIQNNLAYADALEAGHSKQASVGVYGVTERLTAKVLAKRIKI